MFMDKKDRLISNLLIQLNKDGITEKEKGIIGNKLAMAIIKLTKNSELVKRMIDAEKIKIESRQAEEKEFLFDKELLFEDIVSFYYSNSVSTEFGNRKVSPKLTISELLLMGAVFKSITIQHKGFADKKIDEMLRRYSGTDKQSKRVRDAMKNEIYLSSAFGFYIEEIYNSIKEQIAILLGTSFMGLDEIDFNLQKAYKETLASFPLVGKEIKRRRKISECSADEDCILLFGCGDESDDLFSILNKKEEYYAVKNR